jgi:GNAT superfamily N-acetyltransferase
VSELPLPLRALLSTLGPRIVTADLDDRTVVRCPGRPDHRDGNALWLHEPLTVAALDTVLADWQHRFATVPGVEQRQLRWAEDGARDAAPLEEALRTAGLTPRWSHHLELAELGGAPDPVDGLRVVVPADERHWHGVAVQFRHTDRHDDDGFWSWWADGLRVLGDQGRALTLLAFRWGVPVGTTTVHWDPVADVGPEHAGLAAVDDVVVHPAHDGVGIGAVLVHDAVRRLRADKPRARVVMRTDEPPARWERLGFRPTARLGAAVSAHP